jgi:hypothetical protein
MKKIASVLILGTRNILRWFYKEKPKLFISIILILIFGFYILGVLFPIKPIRPFLVDRGITINDIITRFFQFLAAFATFTSAFVALFRDELRRKFLEIQKVNVDFVETEKLAEQSLDEIGETDEKKVLKYLCELQFKNLGNIHEKGCEIYIQNITLKTPINEKTIRKSYHHLLWDNSTQTKILIPVKGKVYLTAFTISPPQNLKEEDSDDETSKSVTSNSQPTLRISENIQFKASEIKDSEIRIEYLLCFETNKPKEFILSIKWNGIWANRIPEMKETICTNLEFPKNV